MKKQTPFVARQGDVLVTRVEEIPDGPAAKPDGARGYVIAYGEESGHAHSIAVKDVAIAVQILEALYLDLPQGGTLRHEHGGQPTGDHDWVTLPPGKYRAVRQREWTGTVSRMVAD